MVGALVASGGAGNASAAPYFHLDDTISGKASTIYDRSFCPGAGQSTVETTGLSGTAPDTFLVVDSPTHGTVSNDDCHAQTSASCVDVSTFTNCFRIIVFAAAPGDEGTANIEVNGGTIDYNVEFNGTLFTLPASFQQDSYAVSSMHPAPRLGGGVPTDLFLFDNSWNLVEVNDQSGAADQPMIEANLGPGDRILMASDTPSAQGSAHLVINACVGDPDRASDPLACQAQGIDEDGDFLADRLEDDAELSPYSSRSLVDTDSDGLTDFYEIIGRWDSSSGNSISLTGLGASPGYPDIFLEFDTGQISDTGVDVPTPTYSHIREIADIYWEVGVSLHADIGQACADPFYCGDWGGTETGLSYNGTYALDYDAIKGNGHFDPVRWGLFHYAYLTDYGSGQTAGFPSSSFYVNGIAAPECLAAHELGHNLGLRHWGSDATPAGATMNHKAAYPSLMNYSYQCKFPPNHSDRGRFSEGTLEPLDPRHLNEEVYSAGVDKAYLEESPYHLDLYGTQDDEVDWNDDGRIGVPGTSGEGVLFDVSPVHKGGGVATKGYGVTGPGWPELHQRATHGGAVTTGGSALAIDPATQSDVSGWAFRPYPDSVFGDPVTLIDASQFSYDSSSAPAFGFPAQLPLVPGQGRETAAAWYPVGDAEVVVVHPNNLGRLTYYTLDTADPTGGSWQTIALLDWPAGVAARSASLHVHDGVLVAVFRDVNEEDGNDNVYVTTFEPAAGWSIPTLMPGVQSLHTPGITTAPDGTLYMAFPDAQASGEPIRFYRKGSGSLGDGQGWVRNSALGDVPSGVDPNWPVLRVTLRSLPYLDEPDPVQAFPDGQGYLAAFWNVGDPSGGTAEPWQLRRAYTTGYLGQSASNPGPPKGWRGQKQMPRAYPGHSPAVAAQGSAVMAVFTGSDFDTRTADSSWFAPYVTGTPPVNPGAHSDHDDETTIHENLCASVWALVHGDDAACYCQTWDPDAVCAQSMTVTPHEESCPYAGSP